VLSGELRVTHSAAFVAALFREQENLPPNIKDQTKKEGGDRQERHSWKLIEVPLACWGYQVRKPQHMGFFQQESVAAQVESNNTSEPKEGNKIQEKELGHQEA
jgi:hypothetical protein